MSIDIGSGSTKFAIADVDTLTHQIENLLVEGSIPVPYQKHLKAFDGSFDEEIRKLGIQAFKKLKDFKDQYQVQKAKAVATEAFRNAVNAEAFIEEIKRDRFSG
ncbi:MAG: Ppx/GppA phosphatase family protein [Parachlamydiaceae bacterium]